MLSTALDPQQRVRAVTFCSSLGRAIALGKRTGYDSPAMGDERRWAARYQFLEELWRGRDRIVCDRELEAALHAGVEGPLAELLAGLLPGEGSGERVWVALHHDRRAASFARERSGTVFVAVDEAAEIASDERWQVALVNLDDPSESKLEAFLEVLSERVEEDAARSVVLSLACGADEDRSYEQLTELVEQLFSNGRVYGLTRPAMVGFYDFGPVLEGEGEGEGEDEPPPEIEIDNTLGSENPRVEVFVAVVGARLPGEGVTWIELPAATGLGAGAGAGAQAGTGAAGDDDELAALRLQLSEAQRRGDLQAIERQSVLEQLEQAADRIASLEDQLDQRGVGDPPGGAETGVDSGPRLDELLAREQTLRWENERLRGELERVETRPVEALEAQVAGLQAQLDDAHEQLELAETQLEAAEALVADDEAEREGDGGQREPLAELVELLDSAEEPSPAQAREWRRARSKLEHLLRKLERGARLSALELHRELALLRRLL